MLHAYQHTHTRIWRYRRLKQAANQDGGFLAKATFYHHSFHTHSELTRNQGDGRQSHSPTRARSIPVIATRRRYGVHTVPRP